MALVISGGTLITPFGRFTADLRVEHGVIRAMGVVSRAPGDTVLDAAGCLVMPGGIDPHTHFEMPLGSGSTNADTWFSASRQALLGGTTTVLDMITQEPGGSLLGVLADWQERAAAGAVVDYGFHMGVIDPRRKVLAEMADVIRAGVPTFKLYLAYKGRLMLDDAEALTVLQAVGRAGGMALVHAENGEVIESLVQRALARGETSPRFHAATRPSIAEAEATARACHLAALAECPLYVVHVSCGAALAEVLAARSRGQAVLAETCTHYLFFTARDLERPDLDGARFILSPPLRDPADQQALWAALADGTVQAVGSDHCPWTPEQRAAGQGRFDRIPNGIPGVGERLPFLLSAGLLEPERIVAAACEGPARTFGLYPRKGVLAPGADADVAIWDPAAPGVWAGEPGHSSPWAGLPVAGRFRHVLVRGVPVVRDGGFLGTAGSGQFLSRKGS